MDTPISLAPNALRPAPQGPCDGATRRLRIFALDPSLRNSAGNVSHLDVPFEELGERFSGQRLQMATSAGPFGAAGKRCVNLDDPHLIASDGRDPTASDPAFLQQMVYAVCSWTMRRFAFALGREPEFAFDGPLLLEPYAFEERNAYYDRGRRALRFGWFPQTCSHCPNGRSKTLTFTAAAQDIIIHEMSHALLDGLRPNLLLPTNPDVLAFHEGFADLVAIFARFSHTDLLEKAIAAQSGDIDGTALIAIGRQFAQGDRQGPLRTSILDPAEYESEEPAKINYHNTFRPHDRGSLLVSAVFEAFRTVYLRKTHSWRSIAASVPTLTDHPVLITALTKTAQKLAGQFLNIIIRAVDYLPPVDPDFGDYLRAMISADADLVPNDDWGYREALSYAFKRYAISVSDVFDLGERTLRWNAGTDIYDTTALRSLGWLPISGPGLRSRNIMRRRAEIVVAFLRANRALWAELGLHDPSRESAAERITVESIRAMQRIGPDGQQMVSFVVEVVAWSQFPGIGWYPGGSTLILDAQGSLRYVIHKRIRSRERRQRTRHYLLGAGAAYRGAFAYSNTPQKVSDAAAAVLLGLHKPCCE